MFSMVWLIILVLAKSLVWTTIAPIFQTPDEQAHFVQLQWYVEKKVLKIDPQKNLSVEVATVEDLLGTRRDLQGNNKFTYHPEYKTPSQIVIPDFPLKDRITYVGNEAALYPPIYYLLSVPFYDVAYNQNIVSRIMAARVLPIILSLLLAGVAYKIGIVVWKEKLFAGVLAILVSFQPMISFVAAGVHPDNLLNLLYSGEILISLLLLKDGIRLKYLVALAILFFLGLETKILMVFFLPVAVAIASYAYFRGNRVGMLVAFLVLISPVAAFIWQWPIPDMPIVTSHSPLAGMNFIDYMRFRGPKIVFEIWPWYWGVFKWLGVTLPPMVMKIITRVAILAGVGLVLRLWRKRDFEWKALVFFIISSASYLLYLVLWDWRVMQAMGYSQGLQGRYLFTNIVPQMALFLAGLTVIKRFSKPTAILLALGIITLNLVALWTVYTIYKV